MMAVAGGILIALLVIAALYVAFWLSLSLILTIASKTNPRRSEHRAHPTAQTMGRHEKSIR